MNKNRDVALFLILCRVVLGKFIRGCDQKLLKTGLSNLSPILGVSDRLFIADPESHTIGIDVRSSAALTAITDHPILWHLEALYQISDMYCKTSFNTETLRFIALFVFTGEKPSLDFIEHGADVAKWQ